MLTIKREKKSAEKIVVDKESLKIFLSGTQLEFLTEANELNPNTITDFPEILEKLGIKVQDVGIDLAERSKTTKGYIPRSDNWCVFKEFMNKKTMFHESPVLQKYDDSIDLITQYVPESMIMDRLRTDVISNHIPQIIKQMGLEYIYEQLIFYEYIYKSENTSYVAKLRVMDENRYSLLMKLLENGDLDLCTTAKTDDDENDDYESSVRSELMTLRLLCNHDKERVWLFKSFIETHSNWLGITVDELNNQCELIFHDAVQQNFTRDQIGVMIATLPESIRSKGLSISHMCLLNALYQRYPLRVRTLVECLIPLLGSCITQLNKTYDEQILLYQGLDLIVRMMEDDVKCINLITKRQQAKIFSLWLRMSSPSYRCFSRSNPYPYYHYNGALDKAHITNSLNRIRDICLSPMIRSALEDSFLTFTEMGYILSADRLDMFQIVCRNIDFKAIHAALFTYMSPRILEFVITKSQKTNESPVIESPESIQINVYDLVERNKNSLRDTFALFDKSFNPGNKKGIAIDYASIINRYDFVECAYIMMYWDYLNIFKNDPKLMATIVEMIANIDNVKYTLKDADLDMVLLKTVLDNCKGGMVDSRDECKIDLVLFNKYVNSLKTKGDMFTTGPNFEEIHTELTRYGVKNLDFLNELCAIQKKILEHIARDRHIDKLVGLVDDDKSEDTKNENADDQEDDEECTDSQDDDQDQNDDQDDSEEDPDDPRNQDD